MASGQLNGVFDVGRVTRFYVPQLLQAFSQSLAYPLVAGIVTHGEHGVDALTAFSQGLMIMFMVGSLGGGLVTTGLVFAKTWVGYVAFRRLNALMMGALLALQCVPALPPFSDWIFSGLFALPPELASIASRTLLLGVVMNGFFFLRNVPMVVLFNNLVVATLRADFRRRSRACRHLAIRASVRGESPEQAAGQDRIRHSEHSATDP